MATKSILSILAALAVSLPSPAEGLFDDATIKARVGYSIGGTAPVDLPASIRKLNNYTLTPSFSFGVDATKPVKGPWGVTFGVKFENKGMHEDATVKNYHESIVRGGEMLAGQFTGSVTTMVREWMLTFPLQANWKASNHLSVRVGPYLSVLVNKSFTGFAHDGYLRVGDPTGPKVELGNTESTRGNYNFSEHMRRFQWGMQIGADWYIAHGFGAYADLSWGMSGIHKSSFKSIEQSLYPIYGTLGVTYNIK